jgi:hypothetical protein
MCHPFVLVFEKPFDPRTAAVSTALGVAAVVIPRTNGAALNRQYSVEKMEMSLRLIILPGRYAVCRLPAEAPWPLWPTGDFVSISRTRDELSIVCAEDAVPPDVYCEPSWRCLRVAGTLDFSVIGALASLTCALAAATISVFTVSTFDTDYLLVKASDLDCACGTLQRHGHTVCGLL